MPVELFQSRLLLTLKTDDFLRMGAPNRILSQ